MAASIVQDSKGLASSRAMLDGISSQIDSASTGPLSEYVSKLGGAVQQLGINGFDSANAIQIMNKNSSMLSSELAQKMGVPTDGKLLTAASATPNAGMTKDAIKNTLGEVKGLIDYKQAMSIAADHAGVMGDPTKMSSFSNDWTSRFPTASIFQFNYLTDSAKKKYIQSMSSSEVANFHRQLSEAARLGYTSIPN